MQNMKTIQLLITLGLLVNLLIPQTQPGKTPIYHSGWIDLNKNGRVVWLTTRIHKPKAPCSTPRMWRAGRVAQRGGSPAPGRSASLPCWTVRCDWRSLESEVVVSQSALRLVRTAVLVGSAQEGGRRLGLGERGRPPQGQRVKGLGGTGYFPW